MKMKLALTLGLLLLSIVASATEKEVTLKADVPLDHTVYLRLSIPNSNEWTLTKAYRKSNLEIYVKKGGIWTRKSPISGYDNGYMYFVLRDAVPDFTGEIRSDLKSVECQVYYEDPPEGRLNFKLASWNPQTKEFAPV